MSLNKIEELYFSASAFKTYLSCKLKFKKRYLEGLYWPTSWNFTPEQQEKIRLGEDFHLLAEKYYSRGKLEALNLIGADLQKWLERLVEFRPYKTEANFYAEQEMRYYDQELKLLAKYDLLYQKDQQIVIYDWKTGDSKPKLKYWSNSVQTLLYRYLLVKASGAKTLLGEINCEDISLIYWNPRYPNTYQPLSYSQWQYERDESRIKNLIAEIKALDSDEFYATDSEEECSYCEYRPICHGKAPLELEIAEDDLELDFNWEELNML